VRENLGAVMTGYRQATGEHFTTIATRSAVPRATKAFLGHPSPIGPAKRVQMEPQRTGPSDQNVDLSVGQIAASQFSEDAVEFFVDQAK
jgi:hypothetical protein